MGISIPDLPTELRLAWCQLWQAFAAAEKHNGRRNLELLWDEPLAIYTRADLIGFAFPGVIFAWSPSRRIAYEHRAGATIAYRDGRAIYADQDNRLLATYELVDPYGHPEWN